LLLERSLMMAGMSANTGNLLALLTLTLQLKKFFI